jgi:hypothetical protein
VIAAPRSEDENARRAVVVSLTPLPLDRDSRAFRIACAFAEAGLRSIVVEGKASRHRFWSDRIEVLWLAAPEESRCRAGLRGGALRDGRLGRGGELALYAAYRWLDGWRHYRRAPGIIPRAELYYLHSFELHRPIAGRGVPIVYDAHDFYRGIEPPERQPSFDRRRLRPFLDRLEDWLVASAAACVTVSDGVAGLMEQTFNRRPVVIRNCHDDRLDQAIEPDLRARLGLSPEDRLCVIVGNRKPGMAVDVASEALARLPDHIHLAFVGRFYEADRDRLRDHPAAKRLHLGHCVAPNEVVPFIRTADLGLVLYERYSDNYRFSLPNGFFQVVAAGLPLVRARLPEIEAAIAGRAIGVCLDHLEPQQLAAAVRYCLGEGRTMRAAMAELADELRWEREAVRLYRLVDQVLPCRAAAPASSCLPVQ